jgi:hypothetical protein
MVKRRIQREAKGSNRRNEHLIAFSNSILTIVVLGAAADPEETINCTLDDLPMALLHYAPRSAALEVGMSNECCMFDRC